MLDWTLEQRKTLLIIASRSLSISIKTAVVGGVVLICVGSMMKPCCWNACQTWEVATPSKRQTDILHQQPQQYVIVGICRLNTSTYNEKFLVLLAKSLNLAKTQKITRNCMKILAS